LGTIEKFDSRQCQPFLNTFVDDKYPPSAIFLEYIPNLEMINLHNCTQKRLDSLVRHIQEIHKASIRHRDPKPRNMMIIKDDPGRVVWIDFDRAETYDKEQLTKRQNDLLDEEEMMVIEFRECLVSVLMLIILQRLIMYSSRRM
jgi:tRNA A-37 threonylcarbamoyl transferase component Bud32